nr:MAG TPA: hypothetical protein [Caudoviricetes sp.]
MYPKICSQVKAILLHIQFLFLIWLHLLHLNQYINYQNVSSMN